MISLKLYRSILILTFLFTGCGSEFHYPFPNMVENSHIKNMDYGENPSFSLETLDGAPLSKGSSVDSYFFRIVVKAQSPGLPFPNGPTDLTKTTAQPYILPVDEEGSSFTLPQKQIIHGSLSLPSDYASIKIWKNQYIIWQGSAEDAFPELFPDTYTAEVNILSPLKGFIPHGYIGFSQGTRYVEYLWILINGFAYPAVEVTKEETLYFNVPAFEGSYSVFTSSNFLINSYIRPDSIHWKSENFNIKGGLSNFPLIMLFWLKPVNLDLHLIPASYSSIDTSADCYYGRENTKWGCQFLGDNNAGFGRNPGGDLFGSPEIISLNKVSDGEYTIAVNSQDLKSYPEEYFTIVLFFKKDKWSAFTYSSKEGETIYPLNISIQKGKIKGVEENQNLTR